MRYESEQHLPPVAGWPGWPARADREPGPRACEASQTSLKGKATRKSPLVVFQSARVCAPSTPRHAPRPVLRPAAQGAGEEPHARDALNQAQSSKRRTVAGGGSSARAAAQRLPSRPACLHGVARGAGAPARARASASPAPRTSRTWRLCSPPCRPPAAPRCPQTAAASCAAARASAPGRGRPPRPGAASELRLQQRGPTASGCAAALMRPWQHRRRRQRAPCAAARQGPPARARL